MSGPVVLWISSPRELLDEQCHLPQAYLFSAGVFRQFMYADTLRLRVVRQSAVEGRRLTADEVSRRVAEIARRSGRPNEPELSMLPGYHAVMAVPLAINHRLDASLGWRIDDLLVARLANGGISLGLLAALVALCRRLSPGNGNWSQQDCDSLAATAWTAAVVLPFHWLVYTDMLALLLIVSVVLAHVVGRPLLAAGIGLLAMTVRQTTVALVATAPIIDLWDDLVGAQAADRAPLAARIGHACRRHWATLMAIVIFLGFVLVNGRISVGPKEAHAFQITLTAMVFSITVFAVCALPLTVCSLWRLVREQPAAIPTRILAIITTAAAVGAYGFAATHDWNHTDVCP